MTAGEAMFYGGLALLAVTAILAVVFAVKKPQYRPGQVAPGDGGATVPLRSGYPTNTLTIRRDVPETGEAAPVASGSAETPEATELIGEKTLLLTEPLGEEE